MIPDDDRNIDGYDDDHDVKDGDGDLQQEEVGRLCLSHVCCGRSNGGEAPG